MYTSLPLKSEKYWQISMQQEIQVMRRLRNQKAIRDFVTFLAGLGAMALGVYAVEHQQSWLPVVTDWLGVVAQQSLFRR